MIAVDNTNGRPDPDAFDIGGSIRSIVRAALDYKWLVLLTTFMTVAIAIVYIAVWPPIYRASALVMVERDTDPVRDSFYLGWNVFRKDDARTEIELMTAGPILKEVVEKEGLGYDDVYHPIMSYAAHLWGESAIGKRYRAIKKKLFPEGNPVDMPSPEEIELAETIVDMATGVSIEPIGESNVGRLTVKGPSRRVAEVANTLLDTYLSRRADRYSFEAQRSVDVLGEQVDEARAALLDVEKRRLAYVEQNTLAFDFQKEALEVQTLTDLESTITKSRMTVVSMEAALAEVEKQLQAEPPDETTSTVFQLNNVRETMKLKLLDYQTALIGARRKYQEDSREVQDIKRSIADLEALIAVASETVEAASTRGVNPVREELESKRNSLKSDLESARAGYASLQASAADLTARLKAVPAKQAALREYDREYAMAQETYNQLAGKQAQASVSEVTANSGMPSMRVVEYAVAPAEKAWPKTKIILPVALMLGLGLGVGASLILSYTSSRIRGDLIGRGLGAPLYGSIRVATRGRPLAAVLSGAAPARPNGHSEAGPE